MQNDSHIFLAVHKFIEETTILTEFLDILPVNFCRIFFDVLNYFMEGTSKLYELVPYPFGLKDKKSFYQNKHIPGIYRLLGGISLHSINIPPKTNKKRTANTKLPAITSDVYFICHGVGWWHQGNNSLIRETIWTCFMKLGLKI